VNHKSDSNTRGNAELGGGVLREAREAAGLGLQEAARRLHTTIHIVEALENGQWERLGAPVFVRGQLRSYAKLLGVDADTVLQQVPVGRVESSELVSRSHTPYYQTLLQNTTRRLVYVVFTIGFVVPVWYATRSHFGSEAPSAAVSLDVVPPIPSVAVAGNASVDGATVQEPVTPPQNRPLPSADSVPYIASLTPLPRPMPAVNNAVLSLSFRGDSWIKVSAPDGKVIEQGLMKPGDHRSYEAGTVARVVLGNSTEVDVQQGGQTVDLSRFRRANVASFAVSSAGVVTSTAE
jgi:cytoskeleton protein RodZ